MGDGSGRWEKGMWERSERLNAEIFLKARGVLEKDFADPQKVERRVVGETEERLYFFC